MVGKGEGSGRGGAEQERVTIGEKEGGWPKEGGRKGYGSMRE